MRAVLTRNRDEFIELKDRIRRAQDANADLFVSVHADSIRDASIAGASVYVLSERGATDEAARWLADRENSADRMGGVPLAGKDPQLDSVLIDLSQTATISASMIAAERVLAALDSVGEVRKPTRAAGGLLRAQVAFHGFDAGRDGLYFKSAGRAPAAHERAAGEARERHFQRHSHLLRSESASRHALCAAAPRLARLAPESPSLP
jgi:hypothetical protein